MSTQITVTLPDRVARRVNEWAIFAHQDVNDIVAMAVEHGLLQLRAAQARQQATIDKQRKQMLDDAER